MYYMIYRIYLVKCRGYYYRSPKNRCDDCSNYYSIQENDFKPLFPQSIAAPLRAATIRGAASNQGLNKILYSELNLNSM